jgi:uncharacterized protein (TIGR02588 family)
MPADDEATRQERPHAANSSVTEWIVAAASLVLVVGTIGFLLYQAVTTIPSSPDVSIHVESVTALRGGHLVRITIINHGGVTAEGVVVEGELTIEDGQKEVSHTEIDYVPAHAERRGGLFFSQDPRRGELRLRVLGYEEP